MPDTATAYINIGVVVSDKGDFNQASIEDVVS